MFKTILEKFKEAAISVLPVSALILILAVAFAGAGVYDVVLFLTGTLFLVVGISFFTLGADIAMMPIGNTIGAFMSKTKKKRLWIVIAIIAVIGFIITIAEPDLQVLAGQLRSPIMIYTVAGGVGFFLAVSVLRTFFNLKLGYVLIASYALVIILGIILQLVNPDYLALSFDSGGVTTGPVTVPFLMALGLGIASVRGTKGNQEDSFGMIALCSVGPIIAVELIGLFGGSGVDVARGVFEKVDGIGDILRLYGDSLLHHSADVALSLLPIVVMFFLFQITVLRLPKIQVGRIIAGIVYTYVGIVVFLTGVNVGFMPMGDLIGAAIASREFSYILIPIGMLIGAVIVLAEPAIHVLNKQVETVTGGSISKKVMLLSLCLGIAVAIGLSMLRVLTGVSIWWFIVPVYVASLILTFFVPKIFVGIAFDSGGVASGPMTTTFLLPLAIGVCRAIGGNMLTDAFGLVAFVAMTPLLTIQAVGLVFKLKMARIERTASVAVQKAPAFSNVWQKGIPDDDVSDTVEF